LTRTFLGHTEAIVSLAFSPNGKLLATGSDDKTVKLWRVSDGTVMKTLSGGSECIYAVTFSPDGQWLASGSRDKGWFGEILEHIFGDRFAGRKGKTIRLWNVRDGTLVQTLAEHSNDVYSLDFSPDGKWLASGSSDATVKLWQLDLNLPKP
jgi:Tol biopolymer transport system component